MILNVFCVNCEAEADLSGFMSGKEWKLKANDHNAISIGFWQNIFWIARRCYIYKIICKTYSCLSVAIMTRETRLEASWWPSRSPHSKDSFKRWATSWVVHVDLSRSKVTDLTIRGQPTPELGEMVIFWGKNGKKWNGIYLNAESWKKPFSLCNLWGCFSLPSL